MTTPKRLSDDDKMGIIWFVTHLTISQRETADIYGVSHTTVQRLVREYRKTPEKFPRISEWAANNIESVTLRDSPLEIVPPATLDLDVVAHTPKEVATPKSGSVRDRRMYRDVHRPLFVNERGVARWVYYTLCAATVGFVVYGFYRIFSA